MADDAKKSDWSAVENAIQRREVRNGPIALPENGPLPPTLSSRSGTPNAVGPVGPPPDGVAEPGGPIARFQVSNVQRKASVAKARAYFDAELEVIRDRLQQVVRVRQAETSMMSEQFLQSITTQHLAFLNELGLRNEKEIGETLFRLNDQTAALLKQASQADWPDSMKQATVDGIVDRFKRFHRRLIDDIGT